MRKSRPRKFKKIFYAILYPVFVHTLCIMIFPPIRLSISKMIFQSKLEQYIKILLQCSINNQYICHLFVIGIFLIWNMSRKIFGQIPSFVCAFFCFHEPIEVPSIIHNLAFIVQCRKLHDKSLVISHIYFT